MPVRQPWSADAIPLVEIYYPESGSIAPQRAMPPNLIEPAEHDAASPADKPAECLGPSPREDIFAVHGMWCSSCAFAVEHFLRRQPGVEHASVNFISSTAFLQWDPTRTDVDILRRHVGRLGYTLSNASSTEESRTRLARERCTLVTRLVVSVAFGMWTVMASALLYFNYGLGPDVHWVLALVASTLALPVVGYAGVPFYRAAWRTLRAGRPGMDVLVSLGVLGAVLFSAWQLWHGSADVYVDTAVMLITLLLVGRLVEMFSRQDGLDALAALDNLTPDTARVWQTGKWVALPLCQVSVGDRIRVESGDSVPVDGVLIDDRASVDRAALTGEHAPITLTRGDRIEAGCHNADTAFTLIVEAGLGKRYIDTLRHRMLELVARKGEVQKLSDTFARWLPTAALCLALITFGFTLLRGVEVEAAFAWALSVLVVACPCAVGLAIPVVTQAASARGLKRGMVFKDMSAFESLARARSIAFDKTGTLTSGRLGLRDIRTAPGIDADRLLQLAAQAERGIMHPVAQTLRSRAIERGLALADDVDTTHYPGQGVEVPLASGAWLRVGSPTWLERCGTRLPDMSDMAGKLVAVSLGAHWQGTLALDETLPAATSKVVCHLRATLTVALLSGDQRASVEAVGKRAGFRQEERYAALTPDAKARLVDVLPKPSVFVGDGINDTLALASATTGISVAGATRQAHDIAAISLLTPGIGRVREAHQLARRAYRLMHQNLGFSIGYNLLALGIALWMPIPPVIAATAMTISSLSVLANAGRLYLDPAD